jgi:putative hydrolase of the HAD superfamily
VLIELAGVEQMLAWSPGLGDTHELWRRWLHSPAVRRFETGGATERVRRAIVGEFDLPVSADEFIAAFTHWPRALFPGATALLTELKPRFRLASVSTPTRSTGGAFATNGRSTGISITIFRRIASAA